MAMNIPPGLDLDADQGGRALGADVATLLLGYIAIGLRFYARRVGGSKYWWDDWLILAAGLYLVPGTIMEIIWYASFGMGRHIQWVLTHQPTALPTFAKMLYADEQLYAPNVTLIKLSILFLYLRIFGVRRRFAIACKVQMVLVVIWAVISECLFLFQCSPISTAWSTNRAAGSCFAFSPLFLGTNAVNTAMDVGILITPLYPIWTLKTTLRKKLLISIVLVLGAGELVFSLLRLVKVGLLTFEDLTWDMAKALEWSDVELHMGIICACLPVMAPLLPRSWAGSSQSNSKPSVLRAGKSDLVYSGSRSGKYGSLDESAHAMVPSKPYVGRMTDMHVRVGPPHLHSHVGAAV